jgi:mono/diheme cytochrome c family protein
MALVAGLAAAPVLAQGTGDADAGLAFATNLCTSCHIVGNERSGSDLAPPFPVIAKDPNTSLIELHSWFGGRPGHPAFDLALTPDQIADINAYLDSLRGTPASSTAPAPARTLPQAPPDRIGDPIGTSK